MRTLIGAFSVALLATTVSAFAGQTEGHIKKIDKDALTLTLDDGKSYKMNPEMDVDSLKPGMDVVIAFDVTDGQNVITDMEVPE
jgi:Cu/Ag efflux protein CusF